VFLYWQDRNDRVRSVDNRDVTKLMTRSRAHGIPSLICTATSKATGERCRKYAIVGSTVCNMHGAGGASAGKDAAERRVTYAQLVGDDQRHPREILLDMVHEADVLTRLCEADLLAANDGTVPVDDRAGLVDLIRTTHGLARDTITSKAYDDAAHAFTRHLELQGRLVAIAIDAIIRGLTRSLDTHHGDRLKAWALAQAHSVLVASQDGEPAELPDVEPPPFARAAVTGEHDVASTHRAIDGVSPYDVARLNDDALAELAGRVLDERNRRINAP
jgi:hypothetical protein